MQPAITLGLLISTRRQDFGLSIAEVSRRVNCNKSTVMRLERGQIANPSPKILMRLAHILELPAAELFALADHPLPTSLPALRDYLQTTYGPLPEPTLRHIEQYLDQARSQPPAETP